MYKILLNDEMKMYDDKVYKFSKQNLCFLQDRETYFVRRIACSFRILYTFKRIIFVFFYCIYIYVNIYFFYLYKISII
jgi:hypothetical protein